MAGSIFSTIHTLYVSQHAKCTERKTILQLLRPKVDVETEVYLQTTGPQDHKTTQKKNIFALALPPPFACLPFVVWIIHKTSNRFELRQSTLSAFYCLNKTKMG